MSESQSDYLWSLPSRDTRLDSRKVNMHRDDNRDVCQDVYGNTRSDTGRVAFARVGSPSPGSGRLRQGRVAFAWVGSPSPGPGRLRQNRHASGFIGSYCVLLWRSYKGPLLLFNHRPTATMMPAIPAALTKLPNPIDSPSHLLPRPPQRRTTKEG